MTPQLEVVMPLYYTIAEAAELLNLTQNTVREFIKRGLIAAVNLGIRKQRITPEEVDRYNRERRKPGPPPGRKQTDATKKKLSEMRKGKNNPFYGKKHTPETLALVSANSARQPRGEQSRAWKGGRVLDDGYYLVYAPDHPNAVGPYVPEHRLIAEQTIGRLLLPTEVVHHINGVTTDNRPENLQVMTVSEHVKLHRSINPTLPRLRKRG
jgi:excisionase family DNA binding protein